jgi:hypothetical protein
MPATTWTKVTSNTTVWIPSNGEVNILYDDANDTYDNDSDTYDGLIFTTWTEVVDNSTPWTKIT